MKIAVIGSGLAGLSAAHSLAARGLKVELLDVGEELDEMRQSLVKNLRLLEPDQWPSEASELFEKNKSFGSGEIPKKMHFGSDYIYSGDRPFSRLSVQATGRVPVPTFAKGGFSNIWGAAALPVDACDMTDWPISRAELDPYFKKVSQFMPICSGEGNLSDAFPNYGQKNSGLNIGPQGCGLLNDLTRSSTRLRAQDTIFGQARLAVHTGNPQGDVLPCNGCGRCFTGCMRQSIFSTVPLLEAMIRAGSLIYRPRFFVDKIDEREKKVQINGIDTRSGERTNLDFDAVFVAAGPIHSARLLLRSRGLYNQPILLRESQKFAIPLLRLSGAETPLSHSGITLASVFLETKVPGLSNHWMHVQFVPMNRMILNASPLSLLGRSWLRPQWNPLLRRFMVAWCGLHSDHSSAVGLVLRKGESDNDILELSLHASASAKIAARTAARDLFRKGLLFKTLFFTALLKRANPGSGTHCGSSFPMQADPRGEFATDTLGRPFGWRRVHVIDSSVLPSIPGTTLAYTVMANAYRIADLAPL